MTVISYLLQNPFYEKDIPTEEFAGHGTILKENLNDIYEDGTDYLNKNPAPSELISFLEKGLNELGYDEGDALNRLNAFIDTNAGSAYRINSVSEIQGGHIAAVYAALKDENGFENNNLDRLWNAANKEMGLNPEGKVKNVAESAGERIKNGLRGLFGKKAQEQLPDASDLIRSMGDRALSSAAGGPNIKAFLRKALPGLTGQAIGASPDALVGALNQYLKTQNFEGTPGYPLESIDDITTEQLSVVVDQAGQKGLLDTPDMKKSLKDMLEEIGIKKFNLSYNDADPVDSSVLRHSHAEAPTIIT